MFGTIISTKQSDFSSVLPDCQTVNTAIFCGKSCSNRSKNTALEVALYEYHSRAVMTSMATRTNKNLHQEYRPGIVAKSSPTSMFWSFFFITPHQTLGAPNALASISHIAATPILWLSKTAPAIHYTSRGSRLFIAWRARAIKGCHNSGSNIYMPRMPRLGHECPRRAHHNSFITHTILPKQTQE